MCGDVVALIACLGLYLHIYSCIWLWVRLRLLLLLWILLSGVCLLLLVWLLVGVRFNIKYVRLSRLNISKHPHSRQRSNCSLKKRKMKKVIFSMVLFTGCFLAFGVTAQVSVSVRMGVPVYCPPPARVVVVSPPPPPPPPRIVVLKPSPVVIAPARPVVLVKPVPPPVYIVGRPRKLVLVCR